MREGRAFGLGVIVATQFPNDMPGDVSGSTATKLYFSQTKAENIREVQRALVGKTSGSDADHLAAALRELPPLACFVQNGQYQPYVRTSVIPYFTRAAESQG
jgi:DNA helicase HerA-like ATPase